MEIIAHRGASHAAPENTLAAVRLAWEEGADALEIDVRLTADARLAVIHDETTKRVAGTTLKVSQSTMAELQRLDVGRWKNERYAGEPIPVLDELLAAVPGGKRVFIELKGGPELIAPLARCLGLAPVDPERVTIIAFDFATVSASRLKLPQYPVAWILDYDAESRRISLDEILSRCRKAEVGALDLGARWPIDANLVEQVHCAGLKLYVWTVDDAATAKHLSAAGVDGITTNRPGWLRAQLAGG